MTDTFLSDLEVRELTGTRLIAKQIDCLKRNRIPFFLTVTGRPRIVRAVLEGRDTRQEPEKKLWTPKHLRGDHGAQTA